MKLLALITVMIISVAASGQDTLNQMITPHDFKRILFGINFSPDMCNAKIGGYDFTSTGTYLIDLLNENKESKLGYTAGLSACFNISRHFGISTGIQYSNKGYAYNDFNNSDIKYVLNYIYLDIPLMAIFSFGEKKICFVSGIGVTSNIFLTTKLENGYKKTTGFKPLNISPAVSAGIDYKISNKINLLIEPTYRYGLLKISNSSITTYLWNAGLNFTCYYRLK